MAAGVIELLCLILFHCLLKNFLEHIVMLNNLLNRESPHDFRFFTMLSRRLRVYN